MPDPIKPLFDPDVIPPGLPPRKHRARGWMLTGMALLACGAAILLSRYALSGGVKPSPALSFSSDDALTPAIDPALESQIVAFCSDCHAMPRPENLPRDRWHAEVQMGYEFYARSERNDLSPPPMHQP